MKTKSNSRSAFLILRLVLAFAFCSVGVALTVAALSPFLIGKTAPTGTSNPVSLINQPLVPDAVAPGGAAFPLTVNGTGFVSGSVVNWNGSARATTFVNSSQLTASILASDIATATTASVTVVSPNPGGISNMMYFLVTNSTSSVTMQESSVIGTSSAETATAGDFNGDGTQDLAVSGRFSSLLSVWLGNGDGSFQSRVDYQVGLFARWVITGDFNGDGKIDLACGGDSDARVSILLGQGDGTFQSPALYATGAGSHWGVVADFNADGKLDLAVAGEGQVSILLGNGDGTFGTHLDYGVGGGYMWVGVGDFNGDNKLDLAVGQTDAPNVSILMGNGDGTFQPHVDYPTGPNPRSLAVGDLNGDGKLDLAVAADSSGQASILLGNGDGTFQPHVDYAAVTAPVWISLGDFNGDGTLDLTLSSFAGLGIGAVILLGNGDGTFQPPLRYVTSGGRVESGTVTDFDGNGRLDLAVANSDSNTVSVLLQGTAGMQTCVLPVAGLVSWWSGDRTAQDVEGINPGRLLKGASFTTGMVGPGFLFNGINQAVIIPNSPSLSQSRITLDAWVYPSGKQGTNRHLISKDNELQEREYILALDGDNKFHAFVQLPSGPKDLTGATLVQLNTWYHVAMTHDGATLKLYVNGSLDGTLDAVGDVVPTANPVGIGGNIIPTLFFQGIIDEAQIFSRVLTHAEILQIYQAGAAGQCKPEIFVSSIDPSYTAFHSRYLVSTSVTVQDANGNAITGATVNMKIRLPSGSDLGFSEETDENGNANFSFYASDTGLYKFKVTRVTHPIRQYDPSLNIETTDTLVIP